ncbi:MAG: RNA 2',3'-cyclic phosphodiesterase [Alphaproteobacteria bacterium]|nr:RNA 2',3'-cyclic phosphodiesterase [Alphaproteobacteria bacterium]
MIRLFTALELPLAARERLAALAGGVPGARWIPPDNMHLTLRFIGDVDEATAGDLADALAAVQARAFDIVIEGVGTFSRGRKPSMLWAGVARNDALMHLQERIDSVLVRAGLPPETRKFSPHVTLARLKDSPRARTEEFIAAHSLLRLPPVRADRFTLFSSFHGREHPTYRAEARYDLAEATS